MSDSNQNAISAEERQRKRLEAWRLRQQKQQQMQQPKPKLSISLSKLSKKKVTQHVNRTFKNNGKAVVSISEFGSEDDEELGDTRQSRKKRMLDLMSDVPSNGISDVVVPIESLSSSSTTTETNQPQSNQFRKRRWDNVGNSVLSESKVNGAVDALDQFMEKLHSDFSQPPNGFDDIPGGFAVNNKTNTIATGAMENFSKQDDVSVLSKNTEKNMLQCEKLGDDSLMLNIDDDQEEKERRSLIDALKNDNATFLPQVAEQHEVEDEYGGSSDPATRTVKLAAEVKDEKTRREERLRELEIEAANVRKITEKSEPVLGRFLYDDLESGVMEEAERNLDAAKAIPDALTVLAELNKKKEIQSVDHSKIDYMTFTKNLYRVPRALSLLTNDDVVDRRAKLKVRVRGHGAPAPIQTFEQSGLSETVLTLLRNQNITEPYPVQAQCIPCIMAGRDVIGIAKTGSGKTLAYLLPLIRHILVQPPLSGNEKGPIALILAPARELAFQIHSVCKAFAKEVGLKSIAVYGGAGVAEQIADLKRGAHIVTATPGRLIDILTMQSGKILSLHRVTYVVMDEADRMFDMGFAPQISALLAAVRPDRQTVLFSATFPKAIESLARQSLRYPIEVVVGGRSVASENVKQYAELVEENDKFFRLLQILGDLIEGNNKAIVFVDTQVRADSLFEQLLRSGYSTLSLHGGKDQEDRDSTIADFKRKEGPNILVATGVAGRGLDVARVSCVVNFSAPNHLEAYVHQTGRTGRAGNTGISYTFVSSNDEAKYAPIIVRALSEAGQSENIDPRLKKLAEAFKLKVEKGEAKFAGSGFKGKGYTYDSSELNEAQRMARIEKRQALIEAGLLDPEEESEDIASKRSKMDVPEKDNKATKDSTTQIKIPENLTPELLALPGMKEALLKSAGIVPADATAGRHDEWGNPCIRQPVQTSDNHWVQEFEINDYPREARWKVTQKETTSRLQEEFRTAVTLKGSYVPPGQEPVDGQRKLYLHLEATSDTNLRNGVLEINRLLNEETLRVGAKANVPSSHKYNVLG